MDEFAFFAKAGTALQRVLHLFFLDLPKPNYPPGKPATNLPPLFSMRCHTIQL